MSAGTKHDLAAITEAQWQSQLVELAHILGWRTMFVRRSMGGRKQGWTTATDCPGWPDLTLWHERLRRFMFIELKSEKGRLTDDQRAVHASLRAAGMDVRVYRPSDLDEAKRHLAAPAVSGEGTP